MSGEDETNSDKASSKDRTNERELSDEYVIVPPNGGFAWVVTAACFMAILISEGILCSFGLILSELERVFHEPAAKVAWIFSIVNGLSLIAGTKKIFFFPKKFTYLIATLLSFSSNRSHCFRTEQPVWLPCGCYNGQSPWFCRTIGLFFSAICRRFVCHFGSPFWDCSRTSFYTDCGWHRILFR